MFNLSFYVICWLCFFLLCLPIIFSGLFAIALEEEKVQTNQSALKALAGKFDKCANDKAKLRALLEEFIQRFKTQPEDESEHSLWLEMISKFVTNMNLMEVDEVVSFQDNLESANPEKKGEIKEAIGKALQKRENK
ncbi:hypothetical protein OQH61_00840 [Helicobacter sp. MIT 21-1697]|uniref:hypothetical protein n=1 Tax=Helicobacter sp. MIT 21-1697 TaxID=2993733 RepID=UPI00224B89E5|nr:hypothetical protein [Helicobacter sp. MIT 21-1697]MCX2716285.1 hypothetical protein [Helicobacter sp. MIT 21-1697]